MLLDELDVSKIELGRVTEGKSKLDSFVPLNYEGGRLHIALAKLPDYTRAPFKAAPGKDKHGNELPGDPAWGMAFDLTPTQHARSSRSSRRRSSRSSFPCATSSCPSWPRPRRTAAA